MNDWREEKIKWLFHELMEHTWCYNNDDFNYIVARLIQKMTTEVIARMKEEEEEENDDE